MGRRWSSMHYREKLLRRLAWLARRFIQHVLCVTCNLVNHPLTNSDLNLDFTSFSKLTVTLWETGGGIRS